MDLSYGLGARAEEVQDFHPVLLFEVQRHGLELKRQCRDGMEYFAVTETPKSVIRGIKELETPSEARKGNTLDGLVLVVT